MKYFKVDGKNLLVELVRFLKLLRETSIVNMLQAAPFLYMGRDYIERHYGDMDMNEPDKFEELLDKADEVRNIMIMVTMNLVNEKYDIDSSIYDSDEEDESEDQSRILRLANKHIKDLANRVLQFYMSSF